MNGDQAGFYGITMPVKTEISSARSIIAKNIWASGTFETAEESLVYHYKKHGEEVRSTSMKQYLDKAEQFSKNIRRVKPSLVQGNTPNVMRYRKLGKFIDIDIATKKSFLLGYCESLIYRKENIMTISPNINIYIKDILRLTSEFEVVDYILFPGGRCKIRIYELLGKNIFLGRSDILIKNRITGELQYPEGNGFTVEEALKKTLENILLMTKEYHNKLTPENIEYRKYHDF
jgi:hypothetical protein